jgi:hypothetical protein
MTFADLLTALEAPGVLRATRTKDYKTSLRYLAHALGHASLDACPVATACLKEDTWGAALETHFTTLEAQGTPISAATRRNTRNNLRVVFRRAAAQGLLTAPLPPVLLQTRPPRLAFRRKQQATSPYLRTYRPQTGPRHMGLPRAQWPPEIQDGWRAYHAKTGHRLRETTFESYRKRLETYLGYITHICGRPPVWEDLFDVERLKAFLRWHADRLQRPLTLQGRSVVICVAAMAKVLKHPASLDLAELRNTLKLPAPVHNKRLHWVSLGELEAVAEACLAEGRAPLAVQSHPPRYPGARRAARFQLGLILKLLVRIPLRQRNVRELRRDEHLYRDQAGHWWLHFSGADLKIGERQGRVNEYRVDLTDYCPEILPLMQEWLRDYRPRMPGAATSPFYFLTSRGKPFNARTLHSELSEAVALRTGKRFYPHLIRTIWASQHLKETQDYATAAVMLGDTVATVMKTYYDIVHKDHHAKAKAFLGTALHTG